MTLTVQTRRNYLHDGQFLGCRTSYAKTHKHCQKGTYCTHSCCVRSRQSIHTKPLIYGSMTALAILAHLVDVGFFPTNWWRRSIASYPRLAKRRLTLYTDNSVMAEQVRSAACKWYPLCAPWTATACDTNEHQQLAKAAGSPGSAAYCLLDAIATCEVRNRAAIGIKLTNNVITSDLMWQLICHVQLSSWCTLCSGLAKGMLTLTPR